MAKTPKVAHMSDHNNNCLFISPEQAIPDLQEFLKENPDYDKVFLIAVSTKIRSLIIVGGREKYFLPRLLPPCICL